VETQTVRNLLSKHSTRQTRWQLANFVIESYGEFQGHAVRAQLGRRREIADQLEDLALNTAHARTLATELQLEAEQLDLWLDQHSERELADLLQLVEEQEAAFWPEHLGRMAAVDLITSGRASKPVMDKAVLLSEDQYRKFAEVCSSIVKVIQDVTQQAERDAGISNPNLPQGQPQ
jgi:hypothetical protein